MRCRRAFLRQCRRAFTIIELLVAMALIVMIMAVLSQAFRAGLDSFSRLKAIGDMADRLRVASAIIRSDLAANHFNGSVRMSDANFARSVDPYTGGPVSVNRPREGYFQIVNYTPGFNPLTGAGYEGFSDPNGTSNIPSFRVPPLPGQSQLLAMSCRYRGLVHDSTFGASVTPGGPLMTFPDPTTVPSQWQDARVQNQSQAIYISPWGEVAYFLQPLPDGSAATGGTPLYSLHRAVLCVVPNRDRLANANVGFNDFNYNAMSGVRIAPSLQFNAPSDLVTATRRGFNYFLKPDSTVNNLLTSDPSAQKDTTNLLVGAESMVLSDVLSFSIEILSVPMPIGPGSQTFMPLFGYPAGPTTSGLTGLNFTIPTGAGYDSSTGNGILAVRVTLRIYDTRTQQSRQVSIVQDM